MRFLYLSLFVLLSIFSAGQQVTLTSTNLPLVIIDTQGKSIVNEPKIVADMKIIYSGNGENNTPASTPNIYDGKVGIELRGKYSQSLPQKPYGFETLDEAGNEMNVSLFGFPEEHDWILLANYNDKTFTRNPIAFNLFNQMGHYASRTIFCELILNGQYEGIYTLEEKIKRDKHRVDIREMDVDDNTDDSLTGGYIFKVDYPEANNSWESNYYPEGYEKGSVRFIYTYPEPDKITIAQKNYLSNHVDEFEDVLFGSNYTDKENGYQTYIDLKSFVDYFIIGEVTRNTDAYKKSCFYYKKPDSKGGLIYAGPVWDFDWAMKNYDKCIYSNVDGSGWAYLVFDCIIDNIPPEWMIRLVSDPYFANKICNRYYSLRETILSDSYIFNYIDSVQNLVDEAQARHYKRWPILGQNVGTPEVDFIPKTYYGEMQKLKDWFSIRLTWLDENMIGEPLSVDIPGVSGLNVYPNPISDFIHIESVEAINELEIISFDGKIIQNLKTERICSCILPANKLVKGIYLLKITTVNNRILFKKLTKTK